MIQKLKTKNLYDFYDFVLRIKDQYQDFYITSNRERKFIKDIAIIEKILKNQEVYGVFEKELKAILIVYKEKGFRPYVKVLAEKIDYAYDLLKFVIWNFETKELFIKVKKINYLCKILQRYNWGFLGDRGTEVLYIKKAIEKREMKHEFHNIKS